MISSSRTIDRADVASHYDELDSFYREVWGDHVHHGLWRTGNESREEAVAALARFVGQKAQIGPGMRVCDIGCGYGATSRLLTRSGAEVTGITISPAQYAVAQSAPVTGSNPHFVLGDWLENGLADESFDAAIAIESSEHMPDLGRFFAQAARVLHPGGRLVVCAWLAADVPSRIAVRWLLEPICREGRMPQMGNAQDYHSTAERAGLALLEFEDITRGVERTWPAIVRRLLRQLATDPRYGRFLFNRHAHNRIFAVTIFRIWLAYRVDAMRYGVFTFAKA